MIKKYKKRSYHRDRLHEIIFEADTRLGKQFDILLLVLILASVVAVMLETIPSAQANFGDLLYTLEWIFTIFFTVEYALRIYVVRKPSKYIFSFFGIVDLLSIIPTYISIFVAGTQSLLIIRALRLLRVFRIFKLVNFTHQGHVILIALRNSRPKIGIFLFFVFIMVCIFGSVMYLIEGESNTGFDSIPRSIYWAIVTLTTVGYGDIAPATPIGQFIAAMVMIVGYATIAVPTGIVTGEIMKSNNDDSNITTQTCQFCSKEGHDYDAIFCKYCGEALHPNRDGFCEE
ncbi:MAG: ion transporter [Saprospiraceae bacterium]|nr:ion transporter [Saprospiraceae bacterium]